MRILVIGDTHIEEDAIDELENIFTEIEEQIKEIYYIIQLGDFFDKKRPSPKEIEFGTKWIKRLSSKCAKFILLRGNHPAIDDKTSAVEYLKYFNNVELQNDCKIDNMFFGHFTVKESMKNFDDDEEMSVEDFRTTDLLMLGHQHHPQDIGSHLQRVGFHLGSIRYVTFGELDSKEKHIAIIDEGDIKFIPLKTPILLKEVNAISELDSLDSNCRVRLVIKSFEQFANEINQIDKWKTKFKTFAIKLAFEKNVYKQATRRDKETLNSLVSKWLEKIKDDAIRQLLLEEINNEG